MASLRRPVAADGAGGRDHAEAHNVDPCGRKARNDSSFQELAAGAGVAADEGNRAPGIPERTGFAQHMGGRHGNFQGNLGGELEVRRAANPVGAEKSSHGPTGISACCTGEPCGPS